MKKRTTATYISAEEYQARLDHYNAWLMHPKLLERASPYPGFPADRKQSSRRAVVPAAETPGEKPLARVAAITVKPRRKNPD